LEYRGYGRPIHAGELEKLEPYCPYPDEWMRAIAGAVTGRPNASIREIIAALKQKNV
jgi:hypothetical protein